jgi:carboxyl-terminal processing protease
MAMGIAGWFVDEKDRYLGKLLLRDTELKAIVFPRPERFAGRLAILVDGLSGSSAEIFAGGLQDLGRARIFGTRTAGAALPSEIIKLPNGDGFQYVIADYLSAGGGHLEGVGVEPDVEVRLTREALLRHRDPVVEAATEWIGQPPAEGAPPSPEAESREAA